MLISMNWISDFVDLTGLDKMALIRQFSLSTAEVENEIFHKGADLSGVVAAQIVSVENHPESHKLHLLKVDAGDGQLTDVVCGAPNVQLGMKTAFAKVGAQLGEGDLKALVRDKKAWILTALRLFVIPAAVLGLWRLCLGQLTDVGQTLVLLSAMPGGTCCALFTRQYGGDWGLATRCVMLSTLCAVVTVPLWLMVTIL